MRVIRITASTSSDAASRPSWTGPLAAALLAALVAGSCGKKGPPLPPLPRTPPPVSDLEVTLAGETLELAWRASPPLEPGPAHVEYYAAWESGPGAAPPEPEQSDLKQVLQRAAQEEGPTIEWPPQSGRRPRRMSWQIETRGLVPEEWVRVVLLTRSGRRHTVSNQVHLQVPAQPPPATSSLELIPEPEGVRVRWEPLESEGRLEMYREERDQPRVLLVHVAPAAGEFEDSSVRLGGSYRYSVRLRRKAGERAWVAGPFVRSELMTYRDIFPPAAPKGLTLVIEGEGVRLLWSPNREPDLAGYRVYRRLEGGEEVKVTELPPWDVTWLDAEPSEGAAVEYRMTAIDSSPQENESAPSDPVSGIVRRPRAITGERPGRPAPRPAGEP